MIEATMCTLFMALSFFIGIAICALAINMLTPFDGDDK